VTVTDANAAQYASVGASVSLSGATAFANFTAAQLNQTFKITKGVAGNWIQLHTTGSNLPNGTLLAYATAPATWSTATATSSPPT
jgi:hypothetical protein